MLAGLLLGSYVWCSLPATAHWISANLIQYRPLDDATAARGATAIAVLTGDSQHARVVEALRLYAVLGPVPIILAGPPLMYRELLSGGIPPERIVMEGSGRTTREQVENVAQIVRANRLGRIALVVSAIHMRRAVAAARTVGLDVVASPSATRHVDRHRFWPAYDALRLSRESLYEYVAFEYYQWRGWAER
jgi:uncharacterized SAM-binding protein YcdF (DUF218 family)